MAALDHATAGAVGQGSRPGAAKLWLKAFGLGFSLVCALLLVTLFTRPPSGDLTRVAKISDHQFGWTITPPPIPMSLVKQSTMSEADVLVVGDSFSLPLAWQSELVKAGYRVTSTHWDWITPICDDLESWLRQEGFQGKLVVFESIERAMPERLDALRTSCPSMPVRQLRLMPQPTESPAQPPAPFRLNWDAKLTSGAETWLNTRRIRNSPSELAMPPLVMATPVPQGCTLFSHPMCDKALFLEDDRLKPQLQVQDADFMAAYSQRFNNLQLRWVVVPNKTSVYLDPQRNNAFSQRVQELKLGPNLFSAAAEGLHTVRDLYWPNDSHWSMQGHIYFGREIANDLRQSLPPTAARVSE